MLLLSLLLCLLEDLLQQLICCKVRHIRPFDPQLCAYSQNLFMLGMFRYDQKCPNNAPSNRCDDLKRQHMWFAHISSDTLDINRVYILPKRIV